MVRKMISFDYEELLAHRPNPKLEDHTLSAVYSCLLNTVIPWLTIDPANEFFG